MFPEPTWIANKRKKKKKIGLYPEGKRFICYGHKRGFEPTDLRPIVIGCWKCEVKRVSR